MDRPRLQRSSARRPHHQPNVSPQQPPGIGPPVQNLATAVKNGDIDLIQKVLFGQGVRKRMKRTLALSLLNLAVSTRNGNFLNVLLHGGQAGEWRSVFRSVIASKGIDIMDRAFSQDITDAELAKIVTALATAADHRDTRYMLVNCELPGSKRKTPLQ